jgi:hypothetical protein
MEITRQRSEAVEVEMWAFGLGDRLDDNLRDILTRLEDRIPTVVVAGHEEQERVYANNERWSAVLLFNEPNEDGVLGTMVTANAHFASVSVEQTRPIGQPIALARYAYSDGFERLDPRHVKKSRTTVRYIRDYVRRRALPELERARAERAAEQQLKARELEVLQRKYLK